MIKEEFIAFLMAKNIDAIVFEQKDPSLFTDWLYLFGQMNPKSFLTQKLFLINQIRRKYQLPLTETKKVSKSDKASKPIVKAVKIPLKGDKDNIARPTIPKPKLKPNTSLSPKLKIPVKPVIKKVNSGSVESSEGSSVDPENKKSTLKPNIPKVSKPSLKPKMPVNKVDKEMGQKVLTPKIPAKKDNQTAKEERIVAPSDLTKPSEKKVPEKC